MNDIVQQLTKSRIGSPPKLLVRCKKCVRLYVTKNWPTQVKRLVRCAACNRINNRFTVRGNRWRSKL